MIKNMIWGRHLVNASTLKRSYGGNKRYRLDFLDILTFDDIFHAFLKHNLIIWLLKGHIRKPWIPLKALVLELFMT